jgi:hypothetical protein
MSKDHSKKSIAEALGYTQEEWDANCSEVFNMWRMGIEARTPVSQIICNVLDDMTILDEAKIYASYVFGANNMGGGQVTIIKLPPGFFGGGII